MKLDSLEKPTGQFGTAPVFFTAISTILGAILFLRFGYAVANVGLMGTVLIVVIGHMVTIPTAMAVAEIATNQKVQGGGAYYIISRSFGINVGATIGIALFFSQAISVAFYVIAFGESFGPALDFLQQSYGWAFLDKRLITIPAMVLLTLLMLTRGADLGVKALYVVVATLFASLVLFFLGQPIDGVTASYQHWVTTVESPAPFFLVFAICFPAFTGMTAGIGLSGDLRNPARSIPLGTLSATLLGMVVYLLVAYKLAVSASPEQLAGDQLIMSRIAVWGPIIPIGLACATASSALGSMMVAPRTLQALAGDEIVRSERLNAWLGAVSGSREPINASAVTAAIAILFVALGDVDFVAQIITMFFMVTYGALCSISFLEHFAGDPSYRPVFRSRWYISLGGALLSFWLMFELNVVYALLSLASMAILYLVVSKLNPDKRGLATIFRGTMFQISRRIQVFLQKSVHEDELTHWRPSVVCISESSFERLAVFDLLRWISHRYGFGTYIHYMEGYASRKTNEEARAALQRLVRLADVSRSNVYVDTLVSPSYTTAVSQVVQIPGIAGTENNTILFEYARDTPEALERVVENYPLVAASGFDVFILGTVARSFGYRREIHLWLTPADYDNANLMILIAYIILGHADWKGAVIKVFALYPEEERTEQEDRLLALIRSGRLPISRNNVEVVARTADMNKVAIINEVSRDADLTILGFHANVLRHKGDEAFAGYDDIGNVLFVNTIKEIDLVGDAPVETPEAVPDAVEVHADGEPAAPAPAENAPSDGEESASSQPQATLRTALRALARSPKPE